MITAIFTILKNYKYLIIGVGAFALGVYFTKAWDASTVAQCRDETKEAMQTHAEYVITSQNAYIKAQTQADVLRKELDDAVNKISEIERKNIEKNKFDNKRNTDDAVGRLRDAASNLRCPDSSTVTDATGGSASSLPAGVLAKLFGECAKKYGEMAAIADEARERGLICERVYDLSAITVK